MHQDENHTRRKGREEKGEKIGCRSCSKSFARKRKPREGAPKKRHHRKGDVFFCTRTRTTPAEKAGKRKGKKSGVVRAQRALRESASPVKVHQKRHHRKGGFFCTRTRTTRAEREEKKRRRSNRALFVRGQRPTPCRGGPIGVSAKTVYLHHTVTSRTLG